MSAPERRSWVLGNETHRQLVGTLICGTEPGWVVTLDPPRRSDLQNKLLHASLSEIAGQLPWPKDTGELHDIEWWKRRCTLQWLIESGARPEVIVGMEGDDFGILLPHTSDLTTKQCAALSEWIIAFGTMNGVAFREKADTEGEGVIAR